jgi:putative flippase GtrA
LLVVLVVLLLLPLLLVFVFGWVACGLLLLMLMLMLMLMMIQKKMLESFLLRLFDKQWQPFLQLVPQNLVLVSNFVTQSLYLAIGYLFSRWSVRVSHCC